MKASFPASTCKDGCKYLQGRMQCTASEMGKRGTEIVSPILDKRKGKNDSHMSHYSPQEISGELSKHQAAERQKGCFQWRVDLPTMYPTFVCQRDCWRHFGEIWYLLPMLREFLSPTWSLIFEVSEDANMLVWNWFGEDLKIGFNSSFLTFQSFGLITDTC